MRSWISLMSVECAVCAGYDLYKCTACLAEYYGYCGPYALMQVKVKKNVLKVGQWSSGKKYEIFVKLNS